MLHKIESLSTSDHIILYRKVCVNNVNECNFSRPKDETMWHRKRECHKIVYQAVCDFLDENIINNNQFCVVCISIVSI